MDDASCLVCHFTPCCPHMSDSRPSNQEELIQRIYRDLTDGYDEECSTR